jgi:hypothetical protein
MHKLMIFAAVINGYKRFIKPGTATHTADFFNSPAEKAGTKLKS